jgi:hypothetical protein
VGKAKKKKAPKVRRPVLQVGSETLLRDATALFSFVDSICSHCDEEGRSAQYLRPSTDFFAYIHELGDGTKAYLNSFSAKAPRDKRLYQHYRQKLETVRYGWFELHELIKAAIDADTLNIPYPLVDSLSRRFCQIRGFEGTRFAIFHFDELNYLQMPISDLKNITERLENIIPDPPAFPPDLGLIGIPYSQSSSIYLNCLITHEMGHFVFEKRLLRSRLLVAIQESVEAVYGEGLVGVSVEQLDQSKDTLESWAEEIFCDLFAIWLTGPCYSLAYIELFGLTANLDPSVSSGFTARPGSVVFSRSHPADLFRLKQHISLLERLNWWKEVYPIKSHYIDILENAAKFSDLAFRFGSTEDDSKTLKAFLKLVPHVTNLLVEVMKDSNGNELDSGLTEYKKLNNAINKYLAHAVVPSTVLSRKVHWYPDIVTLMNASMKFYLEALPEFMEQIEDQNSSLAGHRSRWMKRLESLTGKAIEDHYLLVGEKGAVPVGDTFKRADL